MDYFAPILRSLIAGNIKTTVELTRKQLFCALLVGFSLFFAIFFLFVVIYIVLLDFMDPLWAAVFCSVFWLIIAIGALIAFKIIAVRKRKAYEEQLKEQKANLIAASALAVLPALKQKKAWIVALPLLGVAALYFLNKSDPSKEKE